MRTLVAILLAGVLALPLGMSAGAADGPDSGPGSGASSSSRANATRGPDSDERRGSDGAEACRSLTGNARSLCERNATEEQREEDEEGRDEFHRQRDELLRMAPGERLGRFDLANGTFQGRFVSFAWDAANASLLGYTVAGIVVFDHVRLLGFVGTPDIELEEHGRVVVIEAGDARLMVHDNPAGVLTARAPEGGNVTLRIDAVLNVTRADHALRLHGPGNFTASLSGNNMSLDGFDVRAPRHVTFVAHEDNVALPQAANEHRGDIERAKEHRRIAAEVTVAGVGDDDVEALVLDDIEVNVTRGSRGILVSFDATGLGPRTIILNVAAGLLRGNHVNITYFDGPDGGRRPVPILEADSLADVLDPGNRSVPTYWVVRDRDGVQVLVSVPHFSPHAFEVQGLLEELPPSIVAGSFAAVLFVAAAGAVLFGRKKSR